MYRELVDECGSDSLRGRRKGRDLVVPCALYCFPANWCLLSYPVGRRGGIPLLLGGAFVLIGLLGPVLAISTWYKLQRDMEALRTSSCEVVTGKVTNFRPMPKQGHSLESFQVGKVLFSYSDYNVSHCFNRTASHGGPIQEGLEVRISHNGNCILKLEVLPNP